MKTSEKAARLTALVEAFADDAAFFSDRSRRRIEVRNAIYGLSNGDQAALYELIQEDRA